MKFGSLFTGFGGLDLGLEQSGMECIWQVEINEFAHRYILEPHFPNTKKFYDVRTTEKKQLRAARAVDLICGGFPCQGISAANFNGKGLADERSGLWSQQCRIIDELRPRYAVIENSPRLTRRGLDKILSDLTRLGYAAEGQCLCASDFGYTHERKRLFIVAYPDCYGLEEASLFSASSFKQLESKQTSKVSFLRIQGIKNFYPAIPKSFGMDDGFSTRLDNKIIAEISHGLGNAVVPEIGKWIGKQILEFDKNHKF